MTRLNTISWKSKQRLYYYYFFAIIFSDSSLSRALWRKKLFSIGGLYDEEKTYLKISD
jgi:hypothetical protein